MNEKRMPLTLFLFLIINGSVSTIIGLGSAEIGTEEFYKVSKVLSIHSNVLSNVLASA